MLRAHEIDIVLECPFNFKYNHYIMYNNIIRQYVIRYRNCTIKYFLINLIFN